jgi:hypothetical protein
MTRIIVMAAAASILAVATFAQSTTPTSEVGQRVENQQDRIAQGVKSGSLTAGETSNLEKMESAINQEVRTDRSLNGGHLTGQEKQIVNGQQNKMSNQIYQDKHNAATQHNGNSEVGQRASNQQSRIANGIASGKLNAAQTSRLEKGEAGINKEVHADRQANGGHLTQGQKQQVNKQQNGMSARIYHAKH